MEERIKTLAYDSWKTVAERLENNYPSPYLWNKDIWGKRNSENSLRT